MAKKLLYLAPKATVLQITPRGVFCISYNNSIQNGNAKGSEDDDEFWDED